MRETSDETRRNRITADRADNRDGPCGFLCEQYCRAVGDDNIYGEADQLFGHSGNRLKSPAASRYSILMFRPTPPKQTGASKGATNSFTAPAY
jgi:hypothetical protein